MKNLLYCVTKVRPIGKISHYYVDKAFRYGKNL